VHKEGSDRKGCTVSQTACLTCLVGCGAAGAGRPPRLRRHVRRKVRAAAVAARAARLRRRWQLLSRGSAGGCCYQRYIVRAAGSTWLCRGLCGSLARSSRRLAVCCRRSGHGSAAGPCRTGPCPRTRPGFTSSRCGRRFYAALRFLCGRLALSRRRRLVAVAAVGALPAAAATSAACGCLCSAAAGASAAAAAAAPGGLLASNAAATAPLPLGDAAGAGRRRAVIAVRAAAVSRLLCLHLKRR